MRYFMFVAIFLAAAYVKAEECNIKRHKVNIDPPPPHTRHLSVRESSRIWRNGIVRYVVSGLLDPKVEFLFTQAMEEIESKTCIKFLGKERNHKDYLHVIPTIREICNGSIGRIGGEQKMFLGPLCNTRSIILHLLMRTLGFNYEHNRSDRDEVIHIGWQYIARGFEEAYRIQMPSRDLILTPFDPDSVMLPGSSEHGIADKAPVVMWIYTEDDGDKKLEYFNHTRCKKNLSALDVVKINKLYDCKV